MRPARSTTLTGIAFFALGCIALAVACAAPVPAGGSKNKDEASKEDKNTSKRKLDDSNDDSDESTPKRTGNDDSSNTPRADAGSVAPPPITPRNPEDDGPASSSSGSSGRPTCTRDGDCSLSFICNRNICEVGCRGNADCPLNEHCDLNRGQCVFGSPTQNGSQCTIDENCQLGRICQNGSCVLGCRSSFDCPLSQSCILGFCF